MKIWVLVRASNLERRIVIYHSPDDVILRPPLGPGRTKFGAMVKLQFGGLDSVLVLSEEN